MSEEQMNPPLESTPMMGVHFNLTHADVREPERVGPNSWLISCFKVKPPVFDDPDSPFDFISGVEVFIPLGFEGVLHPYLLPHCRMLPRFTLVNLKPGELVLINYAYSIMDEYTETPGKDEPICRLEVRPIIHIDVAKVTRQGATIPHYNIITKHLGDLDKNQN